MRILFFSPYFHPYVSGLTTFPLQILKHWSVANQISVITFRHDKSLPPSETLGQLTIHRLPYNFRLSKGFISFSSLSIFHSSLKNQDLVITNLPNFEGWPLIYYAKKSHIPVLGIYHCQVKLDSSPINRLVNFSLNQSVNYQLKLADQVIGTSLDYLQSQPMLKQYLSKCRAVYPPIKPPIINRQALTQFHKLKANRIWIGYVGRISREKGLEYLINAIAASPLKNISELVIVGPKLSHVVGESNYYHYILDLIHQTKIHHRFLGFLSTNSLGAFYKSLDVLVLPSVNSTEAFGQVQVEAMFCGTPVIASDLPGVRLPVKETSMGLLVPPKSTPHLTQALNDILTHRPRYTAQSNIKQVTQVIDNQKSLAAYDQILSAYKK